MRYGSLLTSSHSKAPPSGEMRSFAKPCSPVMYNSAAAPEHISMNGAILEFSAVRMSRQLSRSGSNSRKPSSMRTITRRPTGTAASTWRPAGGLNPLGGRPVGLRVAARVGDAGNAVAVEYAHRGYRAVADVGASTRGHAH